jgi:hypothetical protein
MCTTLRTCVLLLAVLTTDGTQRIYRGDGSGGEGEGVDVIISSSSVAYSTSTVPRLDLPRTASVNI